MMGVLAILVVAVFFLVYMLYHNYKHGTLRKIAEANEVLLLLRGTFNNIPVGVYIKNASDDLRYIYINEAAVRFFNNTAEEIKGKTDFQVTSRFNITQQQMRDEDMSVLHSDKPLVFERIVYDEKGTPFMWATVHKQRATFLGHEEMIVATIIETTSVKEKNIQLDNFTRDIKLAVDASKMSIWSYDLASGLFSSVHGHSLVGDARNMEDVLAMMYREDAAKFRKGIDGFCSGKPGDYMDVFRFKIFSGQQKGEYAYKHSRMTAYISPFTGRMQQVIGTERDVTNFMDQHMLLENYKFKMDLLTTAGHYSVWEYDCTEDVFLLDDRRRIDCGVVLEHYLKLVRPDYLQIVTDHMDNMRARLDRMSKIEYYVMDENGEYNWISTLSMPFKKDPDGAVICYAGISQNVNDWKKMNESLVLLKEKAEESNRLKSAFIANMSHEIRTPLNAIVGFSSLIADADSSQERHEYAKLVDMNNELLLRMVGDVLDASRLESGKMEFSFSCFDLNEVIEQQYAVFSDKIPDGVEFTTEVPGCGAVIVSDRCRITQVINNIMNNACKFTEKGSIILGYTVYSHTDVARQPKSITDNSVILYVKDTGRGIPKENFTSIFNRFSKVNDFEQGVGLGLSLSKGIVDRIGGKIWVESELGVGSTFYFSVPVIFKKQS